MVQKVIFVIGALFATLFILYLVASVAGEFFPELYLREWANYILIKVTHGMASGATSFISVIWFYFKALIVAVVMVYGLYRGMKWLLK